MKKLILSLVVCAMTASTQAQTGDSTAFRAYLYNNEYGAFLRINLYDEDVTVPGQELYGLLPGYLSRLTDGRPSGAGSFCWLVTKATLQNEHTAQLSFINDYGSEDLTATLTRQNDSIYILRQREGSTLKIPRNGKWQKLPKTMELKRKE